MNNAKAWSGLEQVKAPADFEDRVIREMDRLRRTAPQRRKTLQLKWALSGSGAALLIGFIVLNLFVFKGDPLTRSGSASAVDVSPIHVTESVKYRPEVQAAAAEPGTIYLLEQVSDASFSMIRY
ncbi:MAG: hypothetical protein ACYDH3_02530 [Candidatus Aminicenantales bacterium]